MTEQNVVFRWLYRLLAVAGLVGNGQAVRRQEAEQAGSDMRRLLLPLVRY